MRHAWVWPESCELTCFSLFDLEICFLIKLRRSTDYIHYPIHREMNTCNSCCSDARSIGEGNYQAVVNCAVQ